MNLYSDGIEIPSESRTHLLIEFRRLVNALQVKINFRLVGRIDNGWRLVIRPNDTADLSDLYNLDDRGMKFVLLFSHGNVNE